MDKAMNPLEPFRRFAACVLIAHHTPGRIRLKLNPLKLSKETADAIKNAKDFRHALDGIPGIKSIRLNLLALSCVVEYNIQVIPAAAWPDLLQGANTPEAGILLNIIEQNMRKAGVSEPS